VLRGGISPSVVNGGRRKIFKLDAAFALLMTAYA
jgi:hypothetical protein